MPNDLGQEQLISPIHLVSVLKDGSPTIPDRLQTPDQIHPLSFPDAIVYLTHKEGIDGYITNLQEQVPRKEKELDAGVSSEYIQQRQNDLEKNGEQLAIALLSGFKKYIVTSYTDMLKAKTGTTTIPVPEDLVSDAFLQTIRTSVIYSQLTSLVEQWNNDSTKRNSLYKRTVTKDPLLSRIVQQKEYYPQSTYNEMMLDLTGESGRTSSPFPQVLETIVSTDASPSKFRSIVAFMRERIPEPIPQNQRRFIHAYLFAMERYITEHEHLPGQEDNEIFNRTIQAGLSQFVHAIEYISIQNDIENPNRRELIERGVTGLMDVYETLYPQRWRLLTTRYPQKIRQARDEINAQVDDAYGIQNLIEEFLRFAPHTAEHFRTEDKKTDGRAIPFVPLEQIVNKISITLLLPYIDHDLVMRNIQEHKGYISDELLQMIQQARLKQLEVLKANRNSS
jgi:hypothetical protein